MRNSLWTLVPLACSTSSVFADPFWIAYEANQDHTPPELQGWERSWNYGEPPTPPQRSVLNGIFTLNSLGLWHVLDYNYRAATVSIDAGEEFVCEYRVRVTGDIHDTWVFIRPGNFGSEIGMTIGPAQVSLGDGTIDIAPGVFHQYRWTSPNMRDFDLYIDGVLRDSRSASNTIGPNMNVLFGDWTFGIAPGAPTSSSEWDYMRFGVIPEPTCGLALLLGFGIIHGARRASP